MPEHDFYALLEREDNKTVFVVDYDTLRKAKSGVISIRDALKHPQTIPFLGGEERAEQYLVKHAQVYGQNIGIWHCDDLDENPRGRLLFLGNYDYFSLNGNYGLYDHGRLLGVGAAEPREDGLVREARHESPQGPYRTSARTGPSIEDILTDARGCVPDLLFETFEERIRARYQ